MELRFAGSKTKIKTEVLSPMAKFEDARYTAKKTGRVIEVTGQCIHCGTIDKPVSEMSLDEMFSWCCEAARRESDLIHQSRNECDLCNQHSPNSVTHRECHDMENFNSQR